MTPVRAYGFALLAFLSCTLLRLALDPWLGTSVPFLLFIPAIIVAAGYGGFGPGLFVTILSAATAFVRYVEPIGELSMKQPADLVRLALFVGSGLLIARLSETLRRAETDRSQLASIVESSDDAIIGKDLNGVITSWNGGAEQLFGYPASEAIGRSITLIIPAERRSEEDEVLRRIRAGLRVEPFETVRRRKDGSDVEVAITVSPIADRGGRITGASKIARDITERRRIERARADLVERQRLAGEAAIAARDGLAFLAEVGAILSSTLDYEETLDRAVHLALPRLGDYCSVVVQDEHGQLRHVACGHVDRAREPALRELARLLIESPAGTQVPTFADRIMESGQTIVVGHDALVQVASAVRPGASPEVAALGREIQPWAYVGVPLFVRSHSVGVMAFGTTEPHSRRDYVDADVLLAEEFARRVSSAVENARLFRKADELNRLKDEFLATLSHEMRTPLSAVLGWSRMLASGELDPVKAKQAIDAIQRNAQAQSRIVDDILDVARGMGGDLRLDLKPFDLVVTVRGSVETVSPAAAAKQIHIIVDAPVAVPIVGDPDRLQQVVWNLMSNALKFTPSGGRVTVAVGTGDGSAELRVADTGAGIPPAFLPYVFDKFRQADASFTRQHGGLGLGLAIARHLVELHGGSIEARSEGEGSGATFIVRLPLPQRPSGSP
jgi:PAS domain S-box-containing protein